MAKLKDKYEKDVIPKLKEALGVKNTMSVPKLEKIVLNMGFGIVDKDQLKSFSEQLGLISGQKVQVNKARKSISNFKLREGMPIGAKVTLRGIRMYEFLERFIGASLPRIRDFRGIPTNSFDGKGNYTLGIKDHTIFPEIAPDSVTAIQGMDITFVTSARDNKDALELLRLLGMPFASKRE